MALLLGAVSVAGCSGPPETQVQRQPAIANASAPAFSGPSDKIPCEDEHRKGYGKEPPGLWLEQLLRELGAPGGHDLTPEDIHDTGTALRIDIPAYDNDPTVYATMLTPGIDPNIPSPPPEQKIGQRGSFGLYLTKSTEFPWQSYHARNDDWQLSLIAYPGADGDEVMWPDHTVDWLKQAVDLAEESPPRCEGPIT